MKYPGGRFEVELVKFAKTFPQMRMLEAMRGEIEDVERGAELLCIIVKFCFQTTKFWFQTVRRTDRQTQ